MPCDKPQPIAQRFIPPVKGIDLEQSLNYTDSRGIDLAWFYDCFTYPRVFYRQGSRPVFDALVEPLRHLPAIDRLKRCLELVITKMPHYAYHGINGPGDRGMSEEDLLHSGQGWCNEQVRVLIALTQAAGLPSRMVYAAMPINQGHVLTEIHIEGKWLLADQTEGHLFTRADGSPVNVLDFKQDPACWREVDALYKAHMTRRRETAPDKAFWDKVVPYGVVDHPLELFHRVGYCNYFIH